MAVENLESLTAAEVESAANDVCWLVRQATVKRKDAGPDVLAQLADDSVVEVRVQVAQHDATPAEALERLADTVHAKIAGRVARNKNTESSTLRDLAERWSVIRHTVALHKEVPTDLLWTMVEQGASRTIRAAVARSANVDHRVCMRAVGDSDAWVRRCLAGNEAATAESLAVLVGDDDDGVRAKLAANPNTPHDLLRQLVGDPDPKVRYALAHNRDADAADRVLAALL